jgi:hypothetical protein
MSARQLFQGVLILSPNDFSKLPGYVDNFDPTDDPIETIEYHYEFQSQFRCSNSRCHQQHGDGFLVRLRSALLSNVGWVCASKADAGFDHKVNQFFQQRQIPQLRAQLWALKNAASDYGRKLKEVELSAWTLIGKKRVLQKAFPVVFETLTKNQNKEVFKVTKIVHERRLTIDQFGKEKEAIVPVEHVVAEIDGIRFLRESLGTLLTEHINPAVRELQEARPDAMTYSQLSKCFSKAQAIDEWLGRAINLQRAGERLLSPATEGAIRKMDGSPFLQMEARRFSLRSLEAGDLGLARPLVKKLSRRERRARGIY